MTPQEREQAYLKMLGHKILGQQTIGRWLEMRRAMVECPICGRMVIDAGDGTPARHEKPEGGACQGGR